MFYQRMPRLALVVAALAVNVIFVAPAKAVAKFYYDPLTGNVSFDTTDTQSGTMLLYYFRIGSETPWQFRYENLLHLSNSQYFNAKPGLIGEETLGTPWRGLYTIGDVLPTGLSEAYWTTAFQEGDSRTPGYLYLDKLGGGYPPPAEFIYGRPKGEFKNRWDLVDPDTLPWATKAKLIYDPRSGEVVLDTTGSTGGYIIGFELTSHGAFLPGGFTSFLDDAATSATTDTVGLVTEAIEPGVYSIGQILPAGLDSNQFEAVFDSALFEGRVGFHGAPFDFQTDGATMSLVYAPEPSTLVLLSAALPACLWPLRRSRWIGRRA